MVEAEIKSAQAKDLLQAIPTDVLLSTLTARFINKPEDKTLKEGVKELGAMVEQEERLELIAQSVEARAAFGLREDAKVDEKLLKKVDGSFFYGDVENMGLEMLPKRFNGYEEFESYVQFGSYGDFRGIRTTERIKPESPFYRWAVLHHIIDDHHMSQEHKYDASDFILLIPGKDPEYKTVVHSFFTGQKGVFGENCALASMFFSMPTESAQNLFEEIRKLPEAAKIFFKKAEKGVKHSWKANTRGLVLIDTEKLDPEIFNPYRPRRYDLSSTPKEKPEYIGFFVGSASLDLTLHKENEEKIERLPYSQN